MSHLQNPCLEIFRNYKLVTGGISVLDAKSMTEEHLPVAIDISGAFSMLPSTCHWIKEIIFSMKISSQGNVIGPSVDRPKSRHFKELSNNWIVEICYRKGKPPFISGIENKWPLSAADAALLAFSLACLLALGTKILFLLSAATCYHFLAILMSFFVPIIVSKASDLGKGGDLLLFRALDCWTWAESNEVKRLTYNWRKWNTSFHVGHGW